MSVRVLSRSESLLNNQTKFRQLSEKTFFTYQDEAGVHLCIVQKRVDDETILILELSDARNIPVLIDNLDWHSDMRVFQQYRFDRNHCLNILSFATRQPSEEEKNETNMRSKLENYYDNSKETIWLDDRAVAKSHVTLYFEEGSVQCDYFCLNDLESWPERPSTFILEERPNK